LVNGEATACGSAGWAGLDGRDILAAGASMLTATSCRTTARPEWLGGAVGCCGYGDRGRMR
jgi:hypothetical protein